jgi:uncharacterized protein YlxW (UPF0749 family)
LPESPIGVGAARPGSGKRSPATWSVLTVLALAVAGGLFVVSRTTARGTDLRPVGRPDLTRLVARTERRVGAELASLRRLRHEVTALTAAAGPGGPASAARHQATQLAAPVGLSAVRGTAIRVTLNDAAHEAGATLPPGVSADDLVVHQQDVQAVVNALWAGGAEAMTIMNQRVIGTSAVRCVGNTLLLQGQVYSPPFVITAVGNQNAMQAALSTSKAVRVYRQYVAALGLGYTERRLSTTLPAYDGPLELVSAHADGAAS